jgi:hypothetical protein
MGFFSKLNPNNWFGSAISAGASLLGNVVGNAQASGNIDKQIAAAREENEKARAFNKAMAEQANQWSIEQWNRENVYNSPAAIRQRLSEGGVNADLFYGQGAQNLASSSPSVTPVSPAVPTDVSGLVTILTNSEIAKVRSINAFTNKVSTNTFHKELELFFKYTMFR